MRFFEHFNISELFRQNSPEELEECLHSNSIDNLFILLQVLDAFRDFINSPVVITSAYRSPDHNKRVGGVPTSQHLLGQALDFKTTKIPHQTAVFLLKEFFEKSALKRFVGQVIIYDSFFHIGLCTPSHSKFYYYDKRNC